MKRLAIYFSVLVQILFLSSLPALAAPAADPSALMTTGLNAAAADSGFNQSLSLPALIGRGLAVLLGLIGIIFVVYIIWAGIMYMTAAGDDTKVKKAKAMITQSVIGIIIMVGAYAISNFVITQLTNAVK